MAKINRKLLLDLIAELADAKELEQSARHELETAKRNLSAAVGRAATLHARIISILQESQKQKTPQE